MTNNYCDCRQGRDPCTCKAVDPVPPAGVEVEVLGYSVKGNRYAIRLTKGELLDMCENYTGGALIELVDRAHFTRLQADLKTALEACDAYGVQVVELRAEVERLTEQLHTRTADLLACGTARKILQSELTKARECIAHVLGLLRADKSSHAQYAILQYQDFPKDQSAPADKGHGGPLSELEVLRAAVKELEAMRDARVDAKLANGEPVAWQIRTKTNRVDSNWTEWTQCSEMERAMHSHEVGKFNRFGIMREIRPLYAEQPAPVAVVLPERKSVNTHNSHDWDEGHADGWVAYDTELKRLNPSL